MLVTWLLAALEDGQEIPETGKDYSDYLTPIHKIGMGVVFILPKSLSIIEPFLRYSRAAFIILRWYLSGPALIKQFQQ